MSIIDRFRDRLEALELERLKVARDRQTYRFLAFLSGFLGICSLLAGLIGASRPVFFLGTTLCLCAGLIWRSRRHLSEVFQIRFREKITREWFHEQFRSAYLVPPPDSLSEDLRVAVREAAVRATAQNPKRTVIEERVLFDRETHQSILLVLREGHLLGAKSRAVVWCKLRSDDSGVAAFVWPPMFATQKKVDLRFFRKGRRADLIEPLATRLSALYDCASRVCAGAIVRVGFAPRGVFVGARLDRRLFEAPVDRSLLEESSFTHWQEDARRVLDPEIRSQLGLIF